MRVSDASLTAPQRRLKLASDTAVDQFDTQEAAGEWLRYRARPQQRVAERCSLNTPEFFTIDDARRLDRHAMEKIGVPPIAEALASEAGFALLPTRPAIPGNGQWHDQLASVTKEVSDATRVVLEVLADGKVEAREIRAKGLVGEIDEAIHAFAQLRALAVAVEQEG